MLLLQQQLGKLVLFRGFVSSYEMRLVFGFYLRILTLGKKINKTCLVASAVPAVLIESRGAEKSTCV